MLGRTEKGETKGRERERLCEAADIYAAVVAPATGPDDALLLSSMLWKSRISEYIICTRTTISIVPVK